MPGIIINDKAVEVQGFPSRSWKDNPALRRGAEDGRTRRTSWVRSIIIHTTKGIPGGRNKAPQTIRPGKGPDQGKEVDVARFWSRSTERSGAHLIIDTDGSIGCIADLATEEMFHAGQTHVNTNSVGIEMYQLGDGSLYEATLDACVALCDTICAELGIQRQIQFPYHRRPVQRLANGGNDCVGVFGHRDITTRRGLGDPGDAIFQKLMAAGYEEFDFEASEDLATWKERQRDLGLKDDGVAGPGSQRALARAGYRRGLWTLGKGS